MAGEAVLLFVYGTLRRGCSNHWMLEGSRLVGVGRVYGYTLVVQGIPYAIRAPNSCSVVGEVYQVNLDTLGAVDELEGHPEYYRRVRVPVELEDGGRLEAYMYEWPHQRAKKCLAQVYQCQP